MQKRNFLGGIYHQAAKLRLFLLHLVDEALRNEDHNDQDDDAHNNRNGPRRQEAEIHKKYPFF